MADYTPFNPKRWRLKPQTNGTEPNATLERYDAHDFGQATFSDNGLPLFPPFVEREGRVMIVGDPKTLKSMLAFAIAYEAACGLQPLGLDKYPPPRPVRTLYGQLEDRRGETQSRYKDFVRSHEDREPAPGMLSIIARHALNLMESAARISFEETLADFKPELVVLDVMRKLFPGDPSKPDEIRPFLEYLDQVIERFKVALLIVHYTPKNSTKLTAAGSTYLDGWPELLVHVHDKRQNSKFTTAQVSFRGRSEELPPLTVVYDKTAAPILSAQASDSLSLDQLRIARRYLGAAWGIYDLIEVLDCSRTWARHWIDDWMEEGLIRLAARTGRGGRKKFSFVPLPGEKRPESGPSVPKTVKNFAPWPGI